MSQEPNRKIDGLLKGYRRQRQKEMPAESEIPFETRQRLQSEVSRRYRPPQPVESRWSKVLWFRAGLVVSLCVGIGGIWLMLFYSGRSLERKTVTPVSETANPNKLAEHFEPVPAARATQPFSLATDSAKPQEALRRSGRVSPQNQPVPVLDSEAIIKREEKVEAPRLAAAASAPSSEKSGFVAANPAILTAGRFTSVDRAAGTARPVQLLTTFDFQRTGPAVKIVDADGSVYAGAMLTPATASGNISRTLQVEDQSHLETYYGFQAAGTNLTLQQRVALTGEVLRSSVDNSAGLLPAAALTSESPAPLTIQATALVGATNQIQIKAVSSPAP